MAPPFRIVMRGYDMAQVDQLVARAEHAAASSDSVLQAVACQELRAARFRDRFRGYSRYQVDRKIDQLARELASG